MSTPHYKAPVGVLEIRTDGKAITGLYILKNDPVKWETSSDPLIKEACIQLDEYFAGKRQRFDLPLSITRGTGFQQTVWKQLIEIPYGKTISYSQLAKAINHPKACRAVGSANGKNPVSILIPCHRVIAADGSLGGYASGLDIKTQLLDLEKKSFHNSQNS
jgi:methylated-DNA-[protein]-cysteine S-methyltransferase